MSRQLSVDMIIKSLQYTNNQVEKFDSTQNTVTLHFGLKHYEETSKNFMETAPKINTMPLLLVLAKLIQALGTIITHLYK